MARLLTFDIRVQSQVFLVYERRQFTLGPALSRIKVNHEQLLVSVTIIRGLGLEFEVGKAGRGLMSGDTLLCRWLLLMHIVDHREFTISLAEAEMLVFPLRVCD